MALPILLAPEDRADVGVFGGSGFYSLLEGPAEQVTMPTPYGAPSDTITLGHIGDVRVAFLPRHGQRHTLPPHTINYRANVWAMAQLGVTRLIAPTAAGSLQREVQRGDFVIVDQFVDRTYGRAQTFYDGPQVVHISSAEPYCADLRMRCIEIGRDLGFNLHERGTVVVVQGPRFSSRAESKWFASQGWQVVNMTQYPEVVLARELQMCYVNISLITDYDVGLDDVEAVTVDEVVRVLHDNNARVRHLIERLLPGLSDERTCACAHALDQAVIS
ncbi:MAG TPA: S-methyl-5'-thioadenosine phosphorylase [Chloroflexota bacterium]|nr:S-methyl-5'-thioadenosine phosphorylase [Chloroflexota bacterium]